MANILIPPPDIKKIIDVLAVKVQQNGQEFADMLKQHMAGDKKYSFLTQPDNPYTPYYKKQLEADQPTGQQEIREMIFNQEEEQTEVQAPEKDCF